MQNRLVIPAAILAVVLGIVVPRAASAQSVEEIHATAQQNLEACQASGSSTDNGQRCYVACLATVQMTNPGEAAAASAASVAAQCDEFHAAVMQEGAGKPPAPTREERVADMARKAQFCEERFAASDCTGLRLADPETGCHAASVCRNQCKSRPGPKVRSGRRTNNDRDFRVDLARCERNYETAREKLGG